MKSSRQRREEIVARRRARATRPVPGLDPSPPARPPGLPPGQAPVDQAALAPDNSYSAPDWLVRGFYEDLPFVCRDCGAEGVWTAARQKWWYEVARGGRWTTARRCRGCRQAERERRAQARRVHLEGLARRARLRRPPEDP